MPADLARLARKIRFVARPRAVILVYHRIIEPECDPFSLAVTPRHFAEHLRVVRDRYVPVPLRELVAAAKQGRVPHRAVAVTFDDGYADNHHTAKPLLEMEEVPATVFVVAGAVDSGEEFWWDRLERLVLHSRPLPAHLSLELAGGSVGWDIRDSGDSMHPHADREWSTRAETDPSTRHRVFRELWSLLQPLSEELRESAMRNLELQLGGGSAPRVENLPLNAAALVELSRGQLVEIGAHGWTHSRLADLPPDARRREIGDARRRLEELTGLPVRSFAYPYGRPEDYGSDTPRIVAEMGFECACANVSGWIVAGVDRFEAPRLRVFDWSGQEFARRLRRFLWA
jgi:peptidoglycan/xylan/chitin deacetylase (PgdA/CDA1 family)